MAFVVTARKYRPRTFDEVVGQDHITGTLKNAIKNGRVAHAYLFTGPRGVGKTTTARILAKAVNCENPKGAEPCNECEMCKSIQNSQLLDIVEIDAASNRGIDEVRTLRESVKYAPSKGKYKVYIIDEVHMLTRDSFNAFLKTLEEPPPHTIFIFATTDVHRVPLTIISRCQRYDFRRIDLDTIKQQLTDIAKAEKIKIDDKTLTLIAKKADGGLRDAESFFDQAAAFCGSNIDFDTVVKVFNFIDEEIYFRVTDAIINKEFKAAFSIVEDIYSNGWNFIDFMEGLVEHFRNVISVIATGSTEILETAEVYKKRYKELDGQFSEGDVLRILNYLNRASQELKYTQNHKLKVEVTLCHIIGLEKTSTITELLGNMESGDDSEEDQPVRKNKPKVQEPEPEKNKKTRTTRKSKSEGKSLKGLKLSSGKTEDQTGSKKQYASFSLSSLQQKWGSFMDEVGREKAMLLGPHVDNVEPVDIEGSTVNISANDEDGKIAFEQHLDYLTRKANDFFGLHMNFIFSHSPDESYPVSAAKSSEKQEKSVDLDSLKSGSAENVDEDDPLAKAIIKKLDAEELRKPN